MYVYQTFKTQTDKATGKRVQVLDKKGRSVPHARWRFEYIDYTGKRRTATGATTKKETKKLAYRVQVQHDEIRQGFRPVPKSADKHATRPFQDVTAEYLAWGKAQGGRRGYGWNSTHARNKKDLLKFWQNKLNLDSMQDLNGILPKVEAILREISEAGRAGKTIEGYRDAICSFCSWCSKRGYIAESPLKNISSWDKTPKSTRRPLTVDEIQRLLNKCRPKFRLLYETAIFSGLRANELRGLQVEDLDVDNEGFALRPEITKNRQRAFQDLSPGLTRRLAESVHAKAHGDRIFFVPRDPCEALYVDLKRAGIPRLGIGGKVVFHCLRNTYINLVLESGASVKESMDLARHSTPDLTFKVYGRSRLERRKDLTESISGKVWDDPKKKPDTITGPEREKAVANYSNISESYSPICAGSIPALGTIFYNSGINKPRRTPAKSHCL